MEWKFEIFFQENAFENVVSKVAAILSRPQHDNPWGAARFREILTVILETVVDQRKRIWYQ